MLDLWICSSFLMSSCSPQAWRLSSLHIQHLSDLSAQHLSPFLCRLLPQASLFGCDCDCDCDSVVEELAQAVLSRCKGCELSDVLRKRALEGFGCQTCHDL